jgi:hypothetical protein
MVPVVVPPIVPAFPLVESEIPVEELTLVALLLLSRAWTVTLNVCVAAGLVGEMLVTASLDGGALYRNWSAADVALVPAGVVTVTSTIPTACAGDVAVMLVSLLKVKFVAAVAPKLTAVTPVKPVPVIATLVPPMLDPDVGLMLETAGGTIVDAVVKPVVCAKFAASADPVAVVAAVVTRIL